MAKRARDTIPHDILQAAEAAGLGAPLWYVGRTNGHKPKPDEPRADDLMREARAEAAAEQAGCSIPGGIDDSAGT
jgi:hypothetical protein